MSLFEFIGGVVQTGISILSDHPEIVDTAIDLLKEKTENIQEIIQNGASFLSEKGIIGKDKAKKIKENKENINEVVKKTTEFLYNSKDNIKQVISISNDVLNKCFDIIDNCDSGSISFSDDNYSESDFEKKTPGLYDSSCEERTDSSKFSFSNHALSLIGLGIFGLYAEKYKNYGASFKELGSDEYKFSAFNSCTYLKCAKDGIKEMSNEKNKFYSGNCVAYQICDDHYNDSIKKKNKYEDNIEFFKENFCCSFQGKYEFVIPDIYEIRTDLRENVFLNIKLDGIIESRVLKFMCKGKFILVLSLVGNNNLSVRKKNNDEDYEFFYKDGSKYKGKLNNFYRCGKGIYKFPNEDVYEGEFDDNGFKGIRYCNHFLDKSEFEGNFIEDYNSRISK